MAMTVALALVLSYVESLVPPFVAIPGVKVGLANIAVVFALYKLGAKAAAAISLVRVLAVSLLFGSGVSLLYSAAGALLSLAGMLFLKRVPAFSLTGVSVLGGVLHNVGQIAVACAMLETNALVYYLPFLLLSGTIAGVAVGLIAAILLKRIDLRI